MNTFFKLNRYKLKPLIIRLSFIFLGAVLIALSIAHMAGVLPNSKLLLYVFIIASIVCPAFILFLGFLIWTLINNTRQKLFNKTPFNNIENIGFQKAKIGNDAKFSFIEEIWKGEVNRYTIFMDISKEKGGKFIEFEIPLEWKKLNQREFDLMTEKLKAHKSEFKIESIVKYYDTRKCDILTLSQLKEDLQILTTLLKNEGFFPRS